MTPVGPVAPVAPLGPVAPVGPVTPVGPVGPVAPVGPISLFNSITTSSAALAENVPPVAPLCIIVKVASLTADSSAKGALNLYNNNPLFESYCGFHNVRSANIKILFFGFC